MGLFEETLQQAVEPGSRRAMTFEELAQLREDYGDGPVPEDEFERLQTPRVDIPTRSGGLFTQLTRALGGLKLPQA